MNPGPGEDKNKFISRCIEHEMSKGHPQQQAIAMCHSMWESKGEMDEIISVPRSGQNCAIAGHYDEIDCSTPLPKNLQSRRDQTQDLDEILPITPLKQP
jgi:hypothetical protein